MALHDKITPEQLGDLHPDPRNPRFPEDQRDWTDEDALYAYLASAFDAISIAESIAQHGYFSSEPLVITEERGSKIVLEGNRRLAALHGLARSDLRSRFDDEARWNAAAERSTIDLSFAVPVIVADEREDADALIGFRHIGSVLAWKPVQRARFLAYLVDTQGETFEGAADSVGEEEAVVRMLYRNQGIINRARELGEPGVAANFTNRFGIFTAALNQSALRDHVGAERVPDVQERVPQLAEEDVPNLVELSSWLYGSNGDAKVIRESREIGDLAEVVANDDAREELRRTRDLHAAYAMLTPSGPPEAKSVMRSLAVGVGHLRTAARSIEIIAGEPRAQELADELSSLSAEIDQAVQSGGGD